MADGCNYWNRTNYIEWMKIKLVTINGNVNKTRYFHLRMPRVNVNSETLLCNSNRSLEQNYWQKFYNKTSSYSLGRSHDQTNTIFELSMKI